MYGWVGVTKILKESARREWAPYIPCDHKNIRMPKEDINNGMNRPRKRQTIPSQLQIGSSKLLEDLQLNYFYINTEKEAKSEPLLPSLPDQLQCQQANRMEEGIGCSEIVEIQKTIESPKYKLWRETVDERLCDFKDMC